MFIALSHCIYPVCAAQVRPSAFPLPSAASSCAATAAAEVRQVDADVMEAALGGSSAYGKGERSSRVESEDSAPSGRPELGSAK